MKMSEINELTLEELEQKEAELRESLFNLRTQKQLGKIEKPTQLQLLRRDLARVKTAKTAKVQGEEL